MRVAALYDIHANLYALDAALREARDESVDLVVIGGDVLPGPMPAETLTRLLELDIPARFIHGNGDRVIAAELTGGDISEVPEGFRDEIRWTARHLSAVQRRLISGWPSTSAVAIPGLGDVLFCHATPRNDTECFTRATPEARLGSVFAGVTADLVVCGHTHMQFDRMVGTRRVVNAGSVGMPFAAPAGAYWLLLGPDVRFRRTEYDYAEAAAQIRATGYPGADAFATRHVLTPPTEAESLQMFAGMELS